ncbi:uncharacterized protein LOC106172138 [Lingula anatina]|uniref:Uncharacterized protein LOC106172138 n=1 Tax=Lingula anatina TaxID=7574 RepID=A0A1S3JDF8_LINAN|nr:uncharacterized protein LOC106172138 [Lingula anatina]|eukprot:XP_013408206.1 uncharacterized protein LOC106172138 [Lingula anatina]
MGVVHFVFLVSTLSSVFTVNVTVLEPRYTDGPEFGLVIIPGAEIKGYTYRPLAEKLQVQAPFKLWVGLVGGFFSNTPNPLELPGGIESALGAMRKAGMTAASKIYLAAHSLGGTFLSAYANTNHKNISGILLYGSYLTRSYNMSAYPVPVLTLSGDMDGLNRITRIQETFQNLQDLYAKDQAVIYRSPVITLPGVNHGQFASGVMPKMVLQNDIPAEVSNDYAYEMIANASKYFMIATAKTPSDLVVVAENQLKQYFQDNQQRMQPIYAVRSMDSLGQTSPWSVVGQQIISRLIDTQKLHVYNQLVNEISLQVDEPNIVAKDGELSITTYTEITYPFNPLDVSFYQQSPSQIQAKMSSSEAVQRYLPNGNFSEPLSCKEVNQAAIYHALSLAAAIPRTRFMKSGRNITITFDDIVSNEEVWLAEPLRITQTHHGLQVTSIGYHPATESNGFYHCKLLSPFRVLEYIYVDSLKPHPSI